MSKLIYDKTALPKKNMTCKSCRFIKSGHSKLICCNSYSGKSEITYKDSCLHYEKKNNIWFLYKIQSFMEYFILFSIIGWLYEVVWCNILENNVGFINNGYLFGPWLPIYGFGMSFILYIFNKYDIHTPGKIFLIGGLTATIAELIGSYIIQFTIGKWMWDYTDEFLNFQGRIALYPSIMFGLLILFGVYFILPKFQYLRNKYNSNKIINYISWIIIILFLVDLILRLKFGNNLIN